MPDSLYLRWIFPKYLGYKLNLKRPRTFNEKINWLKIHDRNPKYTKLVDKIEVKQYVAGIIGIKYIIPTLGVWDKPEDINFDVLPNQFVLKTNHLSGGPSIVICKDKAKFDFSEARRKMSIAMKDEHYTPFREWPYKNVEPRIFAEKYMVDESGYELKDYKFFCFNGEPKFLKVDFNRQFDHHANYYDLKWNMLPFGEKVCPLKKEVMINEPIGFNKMVGLARILAHNIPFLRVDLYNINGRIYFGELTFSPAAGLGIFEPESYDMEIGKLLSLPQ
jgi:hypothetical protein